MFNGELTEIANDIAVQPWHWTGKKRLQNWMFCIAKFNKLWSASLHHLNATETISDANVQNSWVEYRNETGMLFCIEWQVFNGCYYTVSSYFYLRYLPLLPFLATQADATYSNPTPMLPSFAATAPKTTAMYVKTSQVITKSGRANP